MFGCVSPKVTHDLEIDTAQGIQHESAVVVLVILWPQPRRAIVRRACLQGRGVELLDLFDGCKTRVQG